MIPHFIWTVKLFTRYTKNYIQCSPFFFVYHNGLVQLSFLWKDGLRLLFNSFAFMFVLIKHDWYFLFAFLLWSFWRWFSWDSGVGRHRLDNFVVETRYHNYIKMAFNECILTLNLRLNFRKVSYSMYASWALCGQL